VLLGQNERALAGFGKALELDNSLDQAHVGIGQVHEQSGEYEIAIPEHRPAVQYSSGSCLARSASLDTHSRAGATPKAQQVFNELLSA
jgi:tetratricopeptide (TPR) repeat protein